MADRIQFTKEGQHYYSADKEYLIRPVGIDNLYALFQKGYHVEGFENAYVTMKLVDSLDKCIDEAGGCL